MIELYGEIRCDSIFSYSLTLVFKDEVKGKVVDLGEGEGKKTKSREWMMMTVKRQGTFCKMAGKWHWHLAGTGTELVTSLRT
jgi:hypothetical protein